MVEKAHSYGIFVNVFFADKEEDMLKYINIGVDAILTNYPDKLVKLIKTVVERLI
jgi:glycerophosphoryl diester phosphodiesterase